MLESKDLQNFVKNMPKIAGMEDFIVYIKSYLKEKGIFIEGKGNCYEVAECMLKLYDCIHLVDEDGDTLYGAVFTIKPNGDAFLNPLKIRDINGNIHEYTHHTVFIPSFMVADIMHGYIMIDIDAYFKMLYELNGEICFDYRMSIPTYHIEDGISDTSKIMNISFLANLK